MIQIFERMTMGRAVILGCLFAALYYFVVMDGGSAQKSSIQSITVEVQRIQSEIAKADANLQQAADFQRASQSLGDSIQKLLSYIPANFTIGQFMKTVSQEARVAGLDISMIQPKDILTRQDIVVDDFRELGVSIEVKGQYDQLLSFMSSLTRKRQIFIFEKMDIDSEQATTGTGPRDFIKAVAEIRAYSYQGTQR